MVAESASPPGAWQFLLRRAQATQSLLSLQMELTTRCPLRCLHCYTDQSVPTLLDADTGMRVLRQAAGVGCLFVSFTGGEVFSHPQFREIVAEARKLEYSVRLQSSGWQISEAEASWIAESAVARVDLSLYSSDPAVHDHITGTNGSFQRTTAAARLLRAVGTKVVLNTIITRLNAATWASVKRLAAELGCDFKPDAVVAPALTPQRDPRPLRPAISDLREYYGGEAWEQVVRLAQSGLGGRSPDDPPCGAGAISLFVSAEGKVFPCTLLRLVCGDVHCESLEEIWRHSTTLQSIRQLRRGDLPTCARCDLRQHCQHCLALSLTEHGDLLGPALENCRHAVVRRDLLRERAVIPPGERALPPPLVDQSHTTS